MGNTENRTVKRKSDYNNYTIMLVGKMGAGKSSLGNFLLKREHFHAADDLGRVTDKNRERVYESTRWHHAESDRYSWVWGF